MKPRDLGYIALIIFALNLGVSGLHGVIHSLNFLTFPTMGEESPFMRIGIQIAGAALKILVAVWILRNALSFADKLFSRLPLADDTETISIPAFDTERYLYVGIVLAGVFLFFGAIAAMISSIAQFLQFSRFESFASRGMNMHFLISAFLALFTPVPSLLLLINARLIARKLAIRFDAELPPVDSTPE